MKTYAFPALLLGAIALLITSCSRYGNELQYVEFGRVEVKVTDAPFPSHLVSATYVTIDRIEARAKDESSDDAFVLLFEGSEKINIMELTNGMVATLGTSEIPVGTYDLVRLVISGAYVVLEDGTEVDVKVPSGAQSGLKVFIKPGLEVAGELTSELLLDMDLSKSFVFRENPIDPDKIESIIFNPVIRAVNESLTGSLAGTVLAVDPEQTPLAGAQVSLYDGEALYTTTLTNADGAYMLMGVEGGTYQVQAELAGYLSADPVEVNIVPGNLIQQSFDLEPEE
ncbi:DUF4382 domain-containing protein [Robiginitalea sp. SC105]|uniref:DUF4382 domain-containing protein n=1 Tax=Robiginitalea sp. SC105 TaxID=2762332 RepID=UPI0016395C07|nr:DUF4382 domain-containing protein [Robiginitalea sp. SC105]MBC2838443.1 DUF4382 domain-containing protein [Robiginitalea sp. SC105]